MKNVISLFVDALILGIVALLVFRWLGSPLTGLLVAGLIVLCTSLIVIVTHKFGLW